MNRAQRDLIPNRLLIGGRSGCQRLIEWLRVRGWRMTLAELEAERRIRGIRPEVSGDPIYTQRPSTGAGRNPRGSRSPR